MPQKDAEKKRAYQKTYRARNKPWLAEGAKVRGRAWYARAKKNDPKALLLRSAQSRAAANGIECRLTKNDFEIPLVCPLLGAWLAAAEGKAGPNSPSLDRIDSSKGYVPGNIWVISHKANAMKNNASREELATFAQNVLRLL